MVTAVSAQGEDTLKKKCVGCHSLEIITNLKKNTEGWNKTVEKMVSYGAKLTEEEKKNLISYLAETYGLAAKPEEPLTSGNSCVDCHKKKEVISSLPDYQRDYYPEWAGSIHGMNGITCEKCMRGNPTEKNKDMAHKGLMLSSNPDSPIFYLNLPKTCGKCHSEVFDQFSQSTHYKNLEGNRLAPDCVTCHGSHTVSLVNPMVISEKCKVCHNAQTGIKPHIASEARDALLTAKEAGDALTEADLAVKMAKQKGIDVTEAEKSLHLAEEKLNESKVHWHRFDIGLFRSELRDTIDSANKATALVNASFGGSSPPPRGICGPTAVILIAMVALVFIRDGEERA
jgi:hypothetical protein